MKFGMGGGLKMWMADRIRFLFKRQQNRFADNLLLEKNGKVVKNVNIRYCNKNKKWPGRIVANNLKITDYDSFCLLCELENSHTRLIGIIVKKTLFRRIVFKAIGGQSLL